MDALAVQLDPGRHGDADVRTSWQKPRDIDDGKLRRLKSASVAAVNRCLREGACSHMLHSGALVQSWLSTGQVDTQRYSASQ